MKRQKTDSEVINVKILTADKKRLQEMARVMQRTLAGEIRMALRRWIESCGNSARQGNGKINITHRGAAK